MENSGLTFAQRKENARQFYYEWKDKGDEKQETAVFWISFCEKILGKTDITNRIKFEKTVKVENQTKFIDAYIPETRVLIEQKGAHVDLGKKAHQSGGAELTPFEQARRYSQFLPTDETARWIIVCNFKCFEIYNMNDIQPEKKPMIIPLSELKDKINSFDFMFNPDKVAIDKELELSLKAGELVGRIYDRFLLQYNDPQSKQTQHSLNVLCVRLVFCMYAEDAGLFGSPTAFSDYISQYQPKDIRRALIDLFEVLNTPYNDRPDLYLSDELAAFPYVNGGLFADEKITIPQITQELKDTLAESAAFNWSQISPTIFGAVFESTLNPETRRSGGMHYTSIQNIHKVIDPLFLDELKSEMGDILAITVQSEKMKKLVKYQDKLSSLTFLDPACGSGNFLTETYVSIRRLENRVISELNSGQVTLGDVFENPIKVSISQFYGIEINDFAVTVAKTALWIAESQMMAETEAVTRLTLNFLPLKTNASIVAGNALRMDWEDVVSKDKLNYIMGNPPFVGFTYMTAEQKADMDVLFPKVKNLDFVCGWYKIASDYIQNTKIQCGFVSTNSITQGETVARLWDFLNIKINYAYKTFVWNSEANEKAHVHCVIIGFADFDRSEKIIFDGEQSTKVDQINAYLVDAPNIIVTSRNKPLFDVSKMVYGNKPADGGHLIVEDSEYPDFISRDPHSKQYIKPLLGAVEYLHGKKRWCIWLQGVSPTEIRKCPLIMERVKKCKEVREASIAAGIRKFADTPTIFAQITQPVGKNCIIVPRVSSERRKYVPMGFIDGNTIVTDAVQIIPDASIFEFGVMTSNVHMSWMRAVAGRLKSDYRYSKDIVYNNFPWPTPRDEQKAKIEQTAQGILDARALYPDSSLADLYDPLTMPPELRKAHTENDKAVMRAYGFNIKEMSEADCVAELMKLYQKLTEEEKTKAAAKKKK